MLARTVQSCLNGWSVCFVDAVARNAPLQPQLRRRGQPWVFRSTPGCMRAGPSHCRRASKSAPGPKGFALARGLASGSACACGCTCNAAQYRTAACPRGNANWDGRRSPGVLPARRPGAPSPGRAWDQFRRRWRQTHSARAHAHAIYADARPRVQSPRIKPAACAFVGAAEVRWPRPRTAQGGRAAHAKTQRRPELPADLRLQGGVYMCAPLHHRNKPTIHSIMIVLSSPACIRAIMNAFMFHIGAAHNYTRLV